LWSTKITNKNLYETTRTTDIRTLLGKYRWRWKGKKKKKPTKTGRYRESGAKMDPRRGKEERRAKTTWKRTVEKELKEITHTGGEIEKTS
jgi:hypothetical protein